MYKYVANGHWALNCPRFTPIRQQLNTDISNSISAPINGNVHMDLTKSGPGRAIVWN